MSGVVWCGVVWCGVVWDLSHVVVHAPQLAPQPHNLVDVCCVGAGVLLLERLDADLLAFNHRPLRLHHSAAWVMRVM